MWGCFCGYKSTQYKILQQLVSASLEFLSYIMILCYLPGQSPENSELMRRIFTIKWKQNM